jgi:NitT/TauT family transport system ATP-binding protein
MSSTLRKKPPPMRDPIASSSSARVTTVPTSLPGQTAAAASISCKDLVLHFGGGGRALKVLDRVSVEVRPGELLCIVGPSGSGKTTVLNIVAGLLTPTSGSVMIDQEAVKDVRRDVAYMTQKDTLLPWLTAIRNVFLPLEARGIRDRSMQRARELLDVVGLAGFENHFPRQLSGGMRKRVQLARSLAQEPRILLMDEPFGALDYQTKQLIHERFLDIWERDRKTVLFVTHDLNEAIVLADRILVTSNRPARVRDIVDVAIRRPRRMEMLVDDPEYRHVYHTVWNMLRRDFKEAP